jgi:hypothetical protein
VFSSADPNDCEAWMDEMFTTYFDKFASTCLELKLELPYDKDHFVNECLSKGFFACITFFCFAYDMICKSPKFLKRFIWMVEMAVKYSPQYFVQ